MPEASDSSSQSSSSTWAGSSGSNLYLATFLATLFLLLIGSCCIVVRSYVMRRRMRRHIRELLAAEGLGTTPQRCKCRKRRPKFYDRWITPAAGTSWADIMPLSLRVVYGKRSLKPEEPRPEPKPESRRLGLKGWTSSSNSSGQTDSSEKSTTTTTKVEIAQISVLIEMPSRERSTIYGHAKRRLKSDDDDDDDESENDTLPELVLGYARCHKHWWMDVVTDVASARDQNRDTRQPH
ncbi:hypothetical protein D9756_004733 [Leucocoprinus leucothites]|uniref:Uncharacterized protein n=1 Tax=Leucocoprinus leucothites TaxID=201217 RepID=A0A8H5G9S3_9AGAR|nr:hypothetical protein D9756_004733 [Leucoagaricus leucothites]